jgi:hypothetical protein
MKLMKRCTLCSKRIHWWQPTYLGFAHFDCACRSICKASGIDACSNQHIWDLPLEYYILMKIWIERHIRRIRFMLKKWKRNENRNRHE